MPIYNVQPWRSQYYQNIECPEEVVIPTEDWQAWPLYPKHRWIYDKLALAHSQGLEAGPHGVLPSKFPVFSKPIINLRGGGAGSRIIPDLQSYSTSMTPGHFWCTLLQGPHNSTDAAVVSGRVVWWRHATGVPTSGGTFDYWKIHAERKPEIEDQLKDWVIKNLEDYTGLVNFETIDNRIIEAHLRFSDQWPDLYGKGWVEALVKLYVTGRWEFEDSDRKDGFSVLLFGPHRESFVYPPSCVIQKARDVEGVSSLQLTFESGKTSNHYSNPPGGFRLAVINASTLEAGQVAREILRNQKWY